MTFATPLTYFLARLCLWTFDRRLSEGGTIQNIAGAEGLILTSQQSTLDPLRPQLSLWRLAFAGYGSWITSHSIVISGF